MGFAGLGCTDALFHNNLGTRGATAAGPLTLLCKTRRPIRKGIADIRVAKARATRIGPTAALDLTAFRFRIGRTILGRARAIRTGSFGAGFPVTTLRFAIFLLLFIIVGAIEPVARPRQSTAYIGIFIPCTVSHIFASLRPTKVFTSVSSTGAAHLVRAPKSYRIV